MDFPTPARPLHRSASEKVAARLRSGSCTDMPQRAGHECAHSSQRVSINSEVYSSPSSGSSGFCQAPSVRYQTPNTCPTSPLSGSDEAPQAHAKSAPSSPPRTPSPLQLPLATAASRVRAQEFYTSSGSEDAAGVDEARSSERRKPSQTRARSARSERGQEALPQGPTLLSRRVCSTPSPTRCKQELLSGSCSTLGGLRLSPLSASSPNWPLLLQIVDTLQAEKAGLDARLNAMRSERDRLEAENARLRASNLERDRQMAMLLSSIQGRSNSPLFREQPSGNVGMAEGVESR